MRFISLIIMFVLGLWVVSGMPVPVPGVRAVSPNPELGTFAEAAANLPNQNKVQEAVDMGRVSQNPETRRMRERLLDAAQWLEQNPCSDRIKEKFVAAAVPFIEGMKGRRQFPRETFTLDGREVNATDVFNRPVEMAIQDAVHEGRLHTNDLPPGLGLISAEVSDRLAKRFNNTCGS